MNKPQVPCKDCINRSEDCHVFCEVYGKFLKDMDEYKAKRIEELSKSTRADYSANRLKRMRGWKI